MKWIVDSVVKSKCLLARRGHRSTYVRGRTSATVVGLQLLFFLCQPDFSLQSYTVLWKEIISWTPSGYVLEKISFQSTNCWNTMRALRLFQGHWLARASYKILITVYRRVRSMMMIEVKRHTSTGLQFLRTVRDNNPRGSIVTMHYSISEVAYSTSRETTFDTLWNLALVSVFFASETRETFSPSWLLQPGLKVNFYSQLVPLTGSKSLLPAGGFVWD